MQTSAAAARRNLAAAAVVRRTAIAAIAAGGLLLALVPWVAARETELPRIEFVAQDLEAFRPAAAPQDPWLPPARATAPPATDAGPGSDVGIHGRIVDAAGHPVAAVAIRWVLFDGRGEALRLKHALRTGPDGQFTIAGRAPAHRDFVLVALHDAHAPAFVARALPAGDGRHELGDLALGRGGSAAGRVVDPDGAPIAGATVQLRPTTGRFLDAVRAWDDLLPTARTDERGAFRFDRLPAGPARVEAWAAGRQRSRGAEPLAIADDTTADAGVLVLGPGYTLQGRVLGPDGAPQADAEVRVRQAAVAGPRLQVRAFARTTADGSFALDHLPACALRVEVAAAGCLLWSRQPVEPTAGQPLQVQLAAGLTFAGRVVDADTGAPVTQFAHLVQATNPDLEDDNPMPGAPSGLPAPVQHALGRFTAVGLDAGYYRVGIQAPGYAWLQSPPFRLQPGDAAAEREFRLVRGRSLAGAVVGDDGAPIAQARVELRAVLADAATVPAAPAATEAPLVRTTCTDADGQFRFDDLNPATFVLVARRDGFVPHRSTAFVLDRSRDALVLPLSQPASLAGHVRPAPTAGGTVHVVAYGGPGRLHTVRAAADGTFRLEGLAAGNYLVRAGAGDLRDYLRSRLLPCITADGAPAAADAALRPGEARRIVLPVDTPALGDLSGRIAGAGPADRLLLVPEPEPPAAFASRQLAAEPAADGSFRFVGVPAGDYALLVGRRTGGGPARRVGAVSIAADCERHLDVAAPPPPSTPRNPP